MLAFVVSHRLLCVQGSTLKTIGEVMAISKCGLCSKFFIDGCFMTISRVDRERPACLYFVPNRVSVDNGLRRRISDKVKS